MGERGAILDQRRLCDKHGKDFEQDCAACRAYVEQTDVIAAHREDNITSLMSNVELMGLHCQRKDAQFYLEAAQDSVNDAQVLLVEYASLATREQQEYGDA